MKNKTGFTLIELLAVIIILAIIALIATPIVLNVVEESRETARRSSISGYASGVRYAAYDSGFVLTGKYPEVTKEWAEANVQTSGDKVECEEVRYSSTYETVLHKCHVGNNTKEYYFAGNKVYEEATEEYMAIYNSLGNVAVSGKPVVDELKKQYNESNTVGLLKDTDGSYYYKGSNTKVANNFVWFGGHLWRVLSIDTNNNLTMITQQPLTAIKPASSVWTTQAEYEASYINHWLNSETDGVFYKSLTTEDKSKIQNSTFNVGIYTNVSEITTTQKVGLLDETQYTKAGGANSFLDIKDYFWLGNRYSSSHVRYVAYALGGLDNYYPSSTRGVRPVIKISNLTFTAGKGTLTDPYRESSKTTNTSNIKVGEYISIPTSGNDCGEDKRCLFRVVSKDNNSIKVILNGLLPSGSTFGSSATYTSGNTIDTVVTTFANTISSTYRYSGTDKTFGIGEYSGGAANYTAVQNTTYTGDVGLPVAGEMFSGNDIDVTTGSTAKTFVNVATIENPTVSSDFWTMNAQYTTSVYRVHYYGDLNPSNSFSSNTAGVRPVLYLNASSSLTFASGEGTAESPFVLGE